MFYGVYSDMFANKTLSGDLASIFLEFISVVDLECEIRKFCFEFLFTYPCFIEKMKYEFLRIRKFFSYGREKCCLLVSEFDDESAMLFFQEFEQFRGIGEFFVHHR